jgi:hypothetical protein
MTGSVRCAGPCHASGYSNRAALSEPHGAPAEGVAAPPSSSQAVHFGPLGPAAWGFEYSASGPQPSNPASCGPPETAAAKHDGRPSRFRHLSQGSQRSAPRDGSPHGRDGNPSSKKTTKLPPCLVCPPVQGLKQHPIACPSLLPFIFFGTAAARATRGCEWVFSVAEPGCSARPVLIDGGGGHSRPSPTRGGGQRLRKYHWVSKASRIGPVFRQTLGGGRR